MLSMIRMGRLAHAPGVTRAVALSHLALAMLAVICVGLAGAITVVAYDVRVGNDAARLPAASNAVTRTFERAMERARDPADRQQALASVPVVWALRGDSLSDGLQYDVMLIAAHRDGVPPPPGLPRWPLPGEVFLSPQLATDGAAEGIASRYGRFVGEIGVDGLSAVDERIAYIGVTPDVVARSSLGAAESFGGARSRPWYSLRLSGLFGESGYIFPAAHLLAALIGLAAVPAGILLFSARNRIRRTFQPRERILVSLGAGPRDIVWFRIGIVGPALVAAAVAGAALVWAATSLVLRVPITNYLVPAVWLRERLPFVAAAVLTVGLLAAAVVVSGGFRESVADRAPRGPGAWQAVAAGLFPVFAVLTYWAPGQVDPGGHAGWLLTYAVCLLGTFITLPFLLAQATRWALSAVQGLARRRGWPGTLLATAAGSGMPGVLVALFATTAVGVVVLLQGQVFAHTLQGKARDAVALRGHAQYLIAEFSGAVPNAAVVRTDLHEIGVPVISVSLGRDPISVQGDCPSLRGFGLPCHAGPTAAGTALATALPDFLTPDAPVTIDTGSFGTGPQSTLVADAASGQSAAVKQAILRHAWPTLPIDTPLFGYAGSAFATAHQAGWLLVFGGVGLVVVLVAVSLTLLFQLALRARQIAVIGVFSWRRSPAAALGVVLFAAPLLIGGLTGMALSYALTRPAESAGLVRPLDGAIYTAVAAVVLVVAVAATAGSYVVARQAQRRWGAERTAGLGV